MISKERAAELVAKFRDWEQRPDRRQFGETEAEHRSLTMTLWFTMKELLESIAKDEP